jgi:hypothetical protein
VGISDRPSKKLAELGTEKKMAGVGNGGNGGDGSERLDSWKAIAAYLGRDTGTVRRWERTRGLPVHRVPGGKGSSVFAYKSEIDEWLQSAAQETPAELDAQSPEIAPSPQITVEEPRLSAGAGWRWPVASAATVMVLLLGWWMQRPRASVGEMDVAITREGVTARTVDGRELWRYAFDSEWRHPLSEVSERLRVVGGSDPAVYFTTSNQERRTDGLTEGGQFTSLTLGGRPRWTFKFDDTLTVGGKPYGPPWAVTAFSILDANDRRRLAVAAHHWHWGPSVVAILDDTGKRLGTYGHHGWIEQLQWLAPDRLAIGGFSQSWDGGMVALIDPTRVDGQFPEKATAHQCQSCGTNLPLRIVVMPRTEINRATHSRFNRAILERIGDRLTARTVEVPPMGQGVADAIYEFTPALDVVNASFSQRYWEIHDQLFAEKTLDHDRAACPDKDGPRLVHGWSPEKGWTEIRLKPDTTR